MSIRRVEYDQTRDVYDKNSAMMIDELGSTIQAGTWTDFKIVDPKGHMTTASSLNIPFFIHRPNAYDCLFCYLVHDGLKRLNEKKDNFSSPNIQQEITQAY